MSRASAMDTVSTSDPPMVETVGAEKQSPPTPLFSVVVPCYNEEHAVLETISALREHLRDAGQYELVMVNDASTDRTGSILEDAAKDDSTLRVINRGRNGGYGLALKTGIRKSRGEFVVITDADGTYPTERLPELIEQAKKADMVVGARTGAEVTYSKLRRIPKIFLKAYCSWIAGQPIPDMNSGMRVMRRSVLERYLNILPNGFSFTTTITLAMLTNDHDVRYVPINYAARVGRSKIKPVRDTVNFVQLIVRTGMYFAPLRVFFPIALLMGFGFLISLAIDLYFLSITQSTLLLLLFSMNTGMFALLADMIDKRSTRS